MVAKNPVQFQPDLSLMAFLDRYGSEQQCRDALAKARAGRRDGTAKGAVIPVIVTSKAATCTSAIVASSRCR
jgi:hypothetical protein